MSAFIYTKIMQNRGCLLGTVRFLDCELISTFNNALQPRSLQDGFS